MAKDKYISSRSSVSGYSFANLSFFTGLADGIYNAVYSLVLMEIFLSAAVVGWYVAAYAAFCMLVGIFANELLRQFSKVKVLSVAMLGLFVCYIMMSFSIQSFTFITLDFITGMGVTLMGVLVPLFMSDFAGRVSMARLNARSHLWLNIGALFAPMIAVAIAVQFNNRAAFFASGLVYLLGWIFFKTFHVRASDKKIKPVNPRKTMRALLKNTRAFFRRSGLARAYMINFGYYSVRAMRVLYVPIIVIENGFSKDLLGWVLMAGVVPYLLLTPLMGTMVRALGKKIWLQTGFFSFAILSLMATFVTGYPLLGIFVLWQISGAMMESVHDLLFFDNIKKTQQGRFYGVFRTSANLPNIVAPVLGALCIAAFGATSMVWMVSGVIALVAGLAAGVKK